MKKIDLFFDGKYINSTNMSKTCKQAKQKYLDYLKKDSSSAGIKLSERSKLILASPEKLKAFFDKERK